MLLLPAWPLCTLNNEQNFILNIIWLKRMHTSRLQEQQQVAACCSRETGKWAAGTQFPSHLACIEIVWLSCYWAGNWNPLGVWHDSEEDEESRMPVGDPCRGLPNWPLHKGKLTATDVTLLLSLLLCSERLLQVMFSKWVYYLSEHSDGSELQCFLLPLHIIVLKIPALIDVGKTVHSCCMHRC